MSRELKFRAWNSKTKEFEYFELYNITVSDRLLCQHDYPVQQFTGMLDKNGKDIYEGDIVKFDDSGVSEKTVKGIAEVIWCNDFTLVHAPCWSLWFIKPITGFYRNMLGDLEVIGNIFENKDILDS